MSRSFPHPDALRIQDYTYALPEDKIARYPLSSRDASKLLIYRNGMLQEDIYRNVAAYLPEDTLLFFNQTKVVHARLFFEKPTGGRIEIFCLEPGDAYPDIATAMQQHGAVSWKCLVGGAAKWKAGQVLLLQAAFRMGTETVHLQVSAALEKRLEDAFLIRMSWISDAAMPLSFADVLHYSGNLPLPPYLKRSAEATDEHRYQTIFAREEGSVAAPTAALHFTPEVMERLRQKGIRSSFLTLHVGAGTFRPVKSLQMKEHEMHTEWMEVTAAMIADLLQHKKAGHPVVAVGTTSVRTLESLYWIGVRMLRGTWRGQQDIAVHQWYPYDNPSDIPVMESLHAVHAYLLQQQKDRLITRTQIIIAPSYDYRVADGLLTNFHQPQSTLLLLVAAMIGNAWRDVYDYALTHAFRFLSYGDGCLLWKPEPTGG